MKAAQHLDRAEELLYSMANPLPGWDSGQMLAMATEAMAHAEIAVAIELGAPHGQPQEVATDAAGN